MSAASFAQSSVKFSFTPILALDWELKSYITPFNFTPFEIAYQDYKLQILASVPFWLFRDFNDKENSIFIEYTYNLNGLINIAEHLANVCRPVILWTSTKSLERVEKIVKSIQAGGPLLLLIIVEENLPEVFVSNLIGNNPTTQIINIIEINQREVESPFLIWKAYIELFVKLENYLPVDTLLLNLPPDRSTNTKFSDILLLAQSGNITKSTNELEAIPLYSDSIYYPNAIIANHLRYKISSWIKNRLPKKDSEIKNHEYAREIRERKILSLLVDQIIGAKRFINDKIPLPSIISQNLYIFKNVLPIEFSQLVFDILDKTKSEGEIKEVFTKIHSSYPKDIFHLYSFSEFILICQSYPFNYEETIRVTESFLEAPLAYLTNENEYLYNYYFEQMIKGGRGINFELSIDDIKNKNVIEILGQLVTAENNYLSALSVFYAMRRQCPVFKTPRAGKYIFTLFHQLDQLINTHNVNTIDVKDYHTYTETKYITEIEVLMNDLSNYLTGLIDPYILNEIYSSNIDPRVFFLSDIPFDFVRTQSDYLGYTALLSRLPITPGSLPINYYNITGTLTNFDNRVDETVIITSFLVNSSEGNLLKEILKMYNYDQSVIILDINSKFELINYVNNNKKIKCLVFFGHGGIERNSNESWIELPRDNFFNSDIEKLKYVPKTIVLIGCNTSSGGNTMSGMDIPFLQKGAQVIATTFPIPRILGIHFIGMFLSNFLSAGVITLKGTRHYTDLSDILTVVKRRLRISSVLFNLMSNGKLRPGQDITIMNKYVDKMKELEKENMGSDENPSIAIKKVLLEEQVISSYNIPFYEIEKIPYCLFFTCLGYTWNNVNKNLLHDTF